LSANIQKPHDKGLLEAALFLADRPLSVKELARILGSDSAHCTRDLLSELQNDLNSDAHGVELSINEEKALLRVKHGYVDAVAHLARHQDIPRPILRSLAMIAYNHPMTQSDLVKARGNKAYEHVRELINRDLIHADKQGRTLLLHITDNFLHYFDLSSAEEFRFHVATPLSSNDGQ